MGGVSQWEGQLVGGVSQWEESVSGQDSEWVESVSGRSQSVGRAVSGWSQSVGKSVSGVSQWVESVRGANHLTIKLDTLIKRANIQDSDLLHCRNTDDQSSRRKFRA